MSSPIEALLRRLVASHGPHAARLALGMALDQCKTIELAAAQFDWPLHARPKQILPEGHWRSALFQTGRGWGKTRAVVSFALGEIEARRVRHVALVGPTDDQAVAVLVTGAAGLLAMAPPWLAPNYEPSTQRVLFANGVVASIYSAQTPARLRGPEHQLALNTEISFWPESTRDKTFENMELSTRTGGGRWLADTTPTDANPLIERLRAEHFAAPHVHLLIEGSTDENEINLAPGLVKEWRARLRGTDLEATDLDGIYRNSAPDGIFKKASVEATLRGGLAAYDKRIVSIDPSTAGKKHSDGIGIVEVASASGQVYVLRSAGGKLPLDEWVKIALDLYAADRCDELIVEADHASTAWPTIFSGACEKRGWTYTEVTKGAPLRHVPGHVNFHYFYVGNNQKKAERARAAAAWLDNGRVSLVRGALGTLEKQMYAFTGAEGRPDDEVDALVNGIFHLGLTKEAFDPRSSITGIGDLQRMLSASTGADIVGAMPSHAPARGATMNVSGLSVTYDGSRGLRDLFSGSGRGERGL
jgi:phage terminase large subunit-like protein